MMACVSMTIIFVAGDVKSFGTARQSPEKSICTQCRWPADPLSGGSTPPRHPCTAVSNTTRIREVDQKIA